MGFGRLGRREVDFGVVKNPFFHRSLRRFGVGDPASSPASPTKKKTDSICCPFSFLFAGLERAAPVPKLVQKQSGGLFLARGKVHGLQNAPGRVWAGIYNRISKW